MTFDFPNSHKAFGRAIYTPLSGNLEDPYELVDDWPSFKVIERDPKRHITIRAELAPEHLEQLIKDPEIFVIANDEKSAGYIAHLRGVLVPIVHGHLKVIQ
jgi:hypothetical protein